MPVVAEFFQKLDRNKYRKRALISGIILIIILILDLHRFGAWYMESRTYVKPYWLPGMLIVSYPMLKYSISGLIQYLSAKEMFKILHFAMFYISSAPFTFPVAVVYLRSFLFKDVLPWYEKDIFNPGPEFYLGVLLVILSPLPYIALALFEEFQATYIWPWIEKKISGEKDS